MESEGLLPHQPVKLMVLACLACCCPSVRADMLMAGYKYIDDAVVIENAGSFPGYRFHLFPEGPSFDGDKQLQADGDGRIVTSFYHASPPLLFAEPVGVEAPTDVQASLVCATSLGEGPDLFDAPDQPLDEILGSGWSRSLSSSAQRCVEDPPSFFGTPGLAQSRDRLTIVKAVSENSPVVRVEVVYTIKAITDPWIELELEVREISRADLEAAEAARLLEVHEAMFADARAEWAEDSRALLRWPPLLLSLLGLLGLVIRCWLHQPRASSA